MEYETYADVIDSYNSGVGVEAGESLTDYIKRNNIKIKEIDMDPMGDLENILKGSRPMEEGIAQLASTREIDPNVTMEAIVEEFIKRKRRRPRSIEELKEFYFEMQSGGKEMAGDMKMASYEPGKYSDDEIEMYEQYKYDMNEQRPGMPIMEIDDFLRMELGQSRAGVQAGGLPGILGV
jgi:hypothetical protein